MELPEADILAGRARNLSSFCEIINNAIRSDMQDMSELKQAIAPTIRAAKLFLTAMYQLDEELDRDGVCLNRVQDRVSTEESIT